MNRYTTTTILGAILLCCGAALAQPVDFAPFKYEKKATRGETQEHMLNVITQQSPIVWSEWKLLSPFPGAERGSLKKPLPPEDELPKMVAGGPGPNLDAHYKGKKSRDVAWIPFGSETGAPLDFDTFEDKALNTNGTCYLYRALTAEHDCTLRVTMGSDDGLRFWFNGKLLVDADVPRGMTPDEHAVTLDLKQGVNHLFAKISNGGGNWQYQINNRPPLDTSLDAKLQYQLNQDFPSSEDEYYRVATVPVPESVTLEVGGMGCLPDGRPIVSTRRGDVYIVEGADIDTPFAPTFKPFATGLHEALGLAVRQEGGAGKSVVYCVQRGELTRLIDDDGDERADRYETVCDGWGVSGNYHEFAFGPKFDSEGNAWVTLNVGFCGGLGKSIVPYRAWALKITPSGEMVPICDGLRSPNGIGFSGPGGTADVFYADNQGDYVGTNRISQLQPGAFCGHPAGLQWRKDWKQGDPPPPREPATIWFPYKKMGQSTADIVMDETGGKFGPFTGQIFCGDQTLATVMRVFIEKVDGQNQGACFPFRSGLDCGVNRIAFNKNGTMFIGETDRGWGSVGRLRYGIQRLVWTGKVPFEVYTMQAAPDGFLLTFTKDVDPKTATDPASYDMSSYTYEYHAAYGSDEMKTKQVKITAAKLLGPHTIHLQVEGLRAGKDDGGEGYVHELHMPGVKDSTGNTLLHAEAYYTLQKIPTKMPLPPTTPVAAR